MIPEHHKLEVQLAFNAYCHKTLKNEASNAHKIMNRRKQRILNFSDLPFDEEFLFTRDESSDPQEDFNINGNWITKKLLTSAINRLSDEYRKVIELYYFFDLNDRLIGEQFQVPRSTIQFWRSNALTCLKHDLEENADDWSEI